MSDDQEGLICQECGQRQATMHLTDFVDGKAVETHLCEECYGKKDGLPPLSTPKLLEQIFCAIAPELRKLGAKRCPRCGISYLEFRQTLRMGCPNDYEVFSGPLDDLLKRLHGANRHVGKVPVGAAQSGTRRQRLAVLQRELSQVVSREDFQRAAQLRDEIKKLEQKGAGRSDR